MAAAAKPKRERLVARVSAEQREVIEHAATLAGLSLTDFILQAVQHAADETIRDYDDPLRLFIAIGTIAKPHR